MTSSTMDNDKVIVSPWEDISGPDILAILKNPNAQHLLTPANVGHLFQVC